MTDPYGRVGIYHRTSMREELREAGPDGRRNRHGGGLSRATRQTFLCSCPPGRQQSSKDEQQSDLPNIEAAFPSTYHIEIAGSNPLSL